MKLHKTKGLTKFWFWYAYFKTGVDFVVFWTSLPLIIIYRAPRYGNYKEMTAFFHYLRYMLKKVSLRNEWREVLLTFFDLTICQKTFIPQRKSIPKILVAFSITFSFGSRRLFLRVSQGNKSHFLSSSSDTEVAHINLFLRRSCHQLYVETKLL